MKKILIVLIGVIFLMPATANAAFTDSVRGKILLQVEEHGEAWYVDPNTDIRYFMGRPADAFGLMRKLGVGIKHTELQKYLDSQFPSRLSGKIMLDVEEHGEAYYVYPNDKKGYYLGRPDDAFQIMRELGLGITNANLEKITKRTLMETYINDDLYKINYPYNLERDENLESYLEESLLAKATILEANMVSFLKDDDFPALSIGRLVGTSSTTLNEIGANILSDNGVTTFPEIATISGRNALVEIEQTIDEFEMQFVSFIEINPTTYYLISYIVPISERDYYADIFYDEILKSLQILE